MAHTFLQNSLVRSPKEFLRASREALPVAHALLRRGRPELVLRFDGGIGDDLLCTAAIRELQTRRRRRIWMLTSYPELFEGNRDIDFAPRKGLRGVRLALEYLGLKPIELSYARHVNGRDIPPDHHLIGELCRRLNLTGPIKRRPYLELSTDERAYGAIGPNQIAVQSSGLSARYAAATKEWFPERFQEVVHHFRERHTFVQVGSPKDPRLEGAVDLRGKTSIRQTAGVLANSVLFLGLSGFLKHLARSVDCPAVIVYGGREAPEQCGYSGNENVAQRPACSPCWLYGRCEHNVKCMEEISTGQVIAAVERQLARAGAPLAEDVETIPLPPSPAGRPSPSRPPVPVAPPVWAKDLAR
jgi:hypothetical protein